MSDYEWRFRARAAFKEAGPDIYDRGGTCPAGSQHEYTYTPWLGLQSNHGECWKCGDSPGLRWFNEKCDESIRNNECSICGGPREHYGECK